MKPPKAAECQRKLRHPTKAHAEAHRRQLISVGAFGPRLRVYRCGIGGEPHWHVGHPTGSARAK